MTGVERRLSLPEDLASVTRARHFVRDVLLECHLEALVDDAQLGTSELVANAIRHAGTGLLLQIRIDRTVHIAVEDGRPDLRRPVMPETDELAESGRGLHIVAAIAHDWGVTASSVGKTVWFALSLPDHLGDEADVLSMVGRRSPGFVSGYHGPEPGEEEFGPTRREGMGD